MIEARKAGPTVVAVPLVRRGLVYVGLPLAGMAAAILLPALARWAIGWGTGLPMRPVFWAIARVDRPWQLAVAAALGLLLGLSGAVATTRRWTTVTLSEEEICLGAADHTQRIAREDAAAVFLDGPALVVLDGGSRQLAREGAPASKDVLERAFRAYGYPWLDADPYADLYRAWTPGGSELSTEINAVLAAREAALKKKAGREIRDLRCAAQKLGVVVREEATRQYWRPLVRS